MARVGKTAKVVRVRGQRVVGMETNVAKGTGGGERGTIPILIGEKLQTHLPHLPCPGPMSLRHPPSPVLEGRPLLSSSRGAKA